jgi:opacity protein-like surface antigen
MRRVLKALMLTAAVACVAAPAQAGAEGFVSPWAGVNFSGSSGSQGKQAYGVNAGFMGGGVIGAEFSFGWAPNFLELKPVKNRQIDAMANLIVGIPIGGTHGAGLRPFVTGGLGAIHTSIGAISDLRAGDITNTDFGYNLGAGVMGYFATHIGVRADVRYLRTINSNDDIDVSNGLDNFGQGSFHFWRATFGVVIK